MIKIRRYYGHDCDSVSGFNNGYYIDNEPIEVNDHDEAYALCREALGEYWDMTKFDAEDIEDQDNGIQLITGYSDNDGNDMTREQWMDANETKEIGGYRYVYVSYSEE